MAALFEWLQATRLAATVGDSVPLTATLSAIHLLGFTLATGGAFVANLRMLGVLLTDRPVLDIVKPAGRGVAVGLLVSIATGVPLVAPRIVAASANSIFETKMALLAGSAAFHFTIHRWVSRRPYTSRVGLALTGAAGFVLWLSLALAGCAFILLE